MMVARAKYNATTRSICHIIRLLVENDVNRHAVNTYNDDTILHRLARAAIVPDDSNTEDSE